MKKLELLKKVRPVEAPPFLFTRIQEKIRHRETERLPLHWQWAGALAFTFLLAFNLYTISLSKSPKAPPVETLAASMQLHPSNQIYNE